MWFQCVSSRGLFCCVYRRQRHADYAGGGARGYTIPRISVLRFPELFVKAHESTQHYDNVLSKFTHNLHQQTFAHQKSFAVKFNILHTHLHSIITTNFLLFQFLPQLEPYPAFVKRMCFTLSVQWIVEHKIRNYAV